MSSTAEGHHHGPIDWPEDEYMGHATPGKIAMWIFLLSDAFSFGGLLLGYGILRSRAAVWKHPGEPALGIIFTSLLTFLLICSSVTMVMAVAAATERNRKATVKWLALTVLGGILFLCGQAQEYFGAFSFIYAIFSPEHAHGLIHSGLHFGASGYASTFFLITSFHGAHVFTGTTYNSIICIRTAMGKYDDSHDHIEIAGLFWHFVDLVWILVFTLVYLIPFN